MISERMTEELNGHLNAELYSAYLYLSMSSYASYKGLKGAANWLRVQVQEELFHVQKTYDYLDSHGARIVLEAVEKPPAEFGTLLNIFEAVLEHERKVTARINKLMTLAVEEKDHATETFLEWFVTEQTEEEKSARDVIDRLKLGGETGPALFMVDSELAARVYVPPARQSQ